MDPSDQLLQTILITLMIFCVIVLIACIWHARTKARKEYRWFQSLQQGDDVYHKPSRKRLEVISKRTATATIRLIDPLTDEQYVSEMEAIEPWNPADIELS